MKQHQITNALHQIGKQAVPDSLNLWPSIEMQVQPRTSSATYPLRRLVTAAAVVVVVMAAILAVPPLRTLAQEIIDSLFFRPADSAQITKTFAVDIQATPVLAFEPQPNTLADIEAQAGFNVLEPTLPQGYVFDSASYYAEGQGVYHNYHFGDLVGTRNLVLLQQPASAVEVVEVGQNATLEHVQIGTFDGEYLVGWWDSDVAVSQTDSSTQAQVEVKSTWNPNIAMQWLRWQDGEMAYQIMFQSAYIPQPEYYNGGDTTSPGYLTKDDLIAIAESLH